MKILLLLCLFLLSLSTKSQGKQIEDILGSASEDSKSFFYKFIEVSDDVSATAYPPHLDRSATWNPVVGFVEINPKLALIRITVDSSCFRLSLEESKNYAAGGLYMGRLHSDGAKKFIYITTSKKIIYFGDRKYVRAFRYED